ncbi:VOC family protein [Paraglaciecola arctica]|uniref:Glyoxalase family protein n=1 Tax=Paraglaciecola arctica BSs20135 TaxID=493475 RepID=K6YJ34_9ALTE|nr:VOC family protein [Paraglaciecola arctica]GAC18182.1 glyoxalase family protein [Paraglaciecola arctica BSs20135]
MLEHSPLVWAEIAVTDMKRAVAFYQTHFGLSFKHEVMNGMEMSIAETVNIGGPSADTANIVDPSFALLKHQMMVPSRDGSTVYLYLSLTLNGKINALKAAGVEILLPPMAIKEGEAGYIAIFVDCEGNKVGLWSQNL